MASFHAYLTASEEDTWFPQRPALTRANAITGAEVWLDGVDGFGDQFFEARSAGDGLQLVVIPAEGLRASGLDSPSFEALQMVRARILEVPRGEVVARARLERVMALGAWARETPLSAHDKLSTIPGALHPSAELIETVRREQLWISPHMQWRTGLPGAAALYVCHGTEGDERLIVIAPSHALCHLVRL